MSIQPAPLALTSRDFTFGVEFEFGIRFEKRPFKRESQIWELVRDNLIAETGLLVRTELEMEMMDHRDEPSTTDFKATAAGKIVESESFTTWAIVTDSSVCFDEEKRKEKDHNVYYCGIEMRTPVLKFCPEALKEINTVLTALRKQFDVLVNRSCGLHVHVGREREGISHVPLQQLMSTIWVFENQISELLHKSRHFYYKHCALLHMRSNIGIRKFQGNILDIMLGTSNVNDVIDIFGGYENGVGVAYNILDLRQPFLNPVKRTIEFRQHEGCLDPETVLNWASFLVELVAWAHRIERQDFKIFLSKYINLKEGYSVSELFKELGLPESVLAFWRYKVAKLREAEEKEENEVEAYEDDLIPPDVSLSGDSSGSEYSGDIEFEPSPEK